eukprot:432039-Amphidinium_carterae.1
MEYKNNSRSSKCRSYLRACVQHFCSGVEDCKVLVGVKEKVNPGNANPGIPSRPPKKTIRNKVRKTTIFEQMCIPGFLSASDSNASVAPGKACN